MTRGFYMFTFIFIGTFTLQIVGFFSPAWDKQCIVYDENNVTGEVYNQTCYNQGLFYGCDHNEHCEPTSLIDNRVFGISVAIIVLNVAPAVAICLVVFAKSWHTQRKDLKTFAMTAFTITEAMDVAVLIIVFSKKITIGWSCLLFCWSAYAIIFVLTVSFVLCICAALANAEDKKRYTIYYYIVED